MAERLSYRAGAGAHPARLVADTSSASGRDTPVDFAARFDEGPPPVLHVQGAIDISTASELADRLGIASRGGVHPVTVDLNDVDILASAGVRVLFQMRDQLATHGHELILIAADHTPAQQILDLVGLERHSETT